MSDDGRLRFRIGMVGPSRVGKTSLITALLRDSQQLLQGTPVSMKPLGTPTERRIAQHRRELDGSLLAGEFTPGTLAGNQDDFTFHLLLDPGVPDAGIELQLLDYPGGWLDPDRRLHHHNADWERCRGFLRQSSVLIVPIDAAVLMEPLVTSHLRAVPTILTTDQVGATVREWLKERNLRPDEPGLLLLCPVKCESYFADNGGRRDESEKLLAMVRRVYAETIEAVPQEAPHVRTVYCPVDTIGCVEILRADWAPDPREPGQWAFTAHYGVRQPGRQLIKGANDVLGALCRHLVGARHQVEEQSATSKQSEAEQARAFADRKEGFFRNIWLVLNGERQLRRDAASGIEQEAVGAAARVAALTRIVEDLARRESGDRVRQW
ncbi:MAG: hypothetical protein ACRDRH_21015 [Pseudonocardia sp.]